MLNLEQAASTVDHHILEMLSDLSIGDLTGG
jgi:hypothetical protein